MTQICVFECAQMAAMRTQKPANVYQHVMTPNMLTIQPIYVFKIVQGILLCMLIPQTINAYSNANLLILHTRKIELVFKSVRQMIYIGKIQPRAVLNTVTTNKKHMHAIPLNIVCLDVQ